MMKEQFEFIYPYEKRQYEKAEIYSYRAEKGGHMRLVWMAAKKNEKKKENFCRKNRKLCR